jgi:hypothetical protein
MDTNGLPTHELKAKRWNARIARKALDEFADVTGRVCAVA